MRIPLMLAALLAAGTPIILMGQSAPSKPAADSAGRARAARQKYIADSIRHFDSVYDVLEKSGMETPRSRARAAAERLRADSSVRAAAEAAAQERERQRQARILKSDWPMDTKIAALQRALLIGMTPDQVTSSWGKPLKVKVTVTAKGRHEEWVYGLDWSAEFDDAKLVKYNGAFSPN